VNFRFESRVHDDDTYTVWAIDRAPGHATDQHAWHVADVFFNGGEWLFVRYDLTGELVVVLDGTDDDGNPKRAVRWINADPEQWAELRDFTNHVNSERHKRSEAENAALDKALAIRRLKFRDDTREDARLMGVALSRVWARTLFEL
jgi:hypothetical protein